MIMQKAVRVIYDMSEDTKIREVARLREKALHDEASALKNAKAEGIEEGMTEAEINTFCRSRVNAHSEETIESGIGEIIPWFRFLYSVIKFNTDSIIQILDKG